MTNLNELVEKYYDIAVEINPAVTRNDLIEVADQAFVNYMGYCMVYYYFKDIWPKGEMKWE